MIGCALERIVRNWGGNIEVSYRTLDAPKTVSELCRVVKRARRVRVLGALHSFSPILHAPDVAVSTEDLPRSIQVLPEAEQVDENVVLVRIEGRWTMGRLMEALHDRNLALPSVGSSVLPTFFGSLATATHGSGLQFGSMSNRCFLRGLELVLGDGSLVRLSDQDPQTADRAGGQSGRARAHGRRGVRDHRLRAAVQPVHRDGGGLLRRRPAARALRRRQALPRCSGSPTRRPCRG